MPFAIRCGLFAPKFCEVNVVIAAAIAANGSVENAKMRRAEVCALMMTGPSALIED